MKSSLRGRRSRWRSASSPTIRRKKARGSTWRRSNSRPSPSSAWIGGSPRPSCYAAKCWRGRTAALKRAKPSAGNSLKINQGRNCIDTTQMYRNLLEKLLSMAVKVKQHKGKWWVFIDHKGKRKAKCVGSKQAAETAARKIEAKLTLGDFTLLDEKPHHPFDAYFRNWLDTYVKAHCKERTYDLYEDIFRI